MTSLFMPFDLGYFWMCFMFLPLSIFFFLNKFYSLSMNLHIYSFIHNFLSNFFYSLKPKMFNKLSSLIFLSLFVFILFMNLFSVFSYNFPISSQVSVVMFLSLNCWFSLVSFSIINNSKGFMSHLIPEGTPLPLTFLLYLIELVSSLIRPLTLMVRLVANILAGHLLMVLLSSLIFQFSFSFPLYLGLNLVELMVALIQAYIFSTMTVLYFSEI